MNDKDNPRKVEHGKRVKIRYLCKTEDGQIVEEISSRQPSSIVIGQAEVIPGLDNGLIGMVAGESKQIKVEPEQAFGPWQEELTMATELSQFPDDEQPQVGDVLEMENDTVGLIEVTVMKIENNNVTLDANHPLAGKVLYFELELLGILD